MIFKSLFYLLCCYILGFSQVVETKEPGIILKGNVEAGAGCVSPIQLFVSNKKNELLYQVEVPVNGSFFFYLKKGTYKFHGANQEGCVSNNYEILVDRKKDILIRIEKQKMVKN